MLAHELSHHVHHDLWRAVALQAALLVAGFLRGARGACSGLPRRCGFAAWTTRPACRCCCWPAARASFVFTAARQRRCRDRTSGAPIATRSTRPAAGGVHLGHEAAVAAEPGRRPSVAPGAVAVLFAPADSAADRAARAGPPAGGAEHAATRRSRAAWVHQAADASLAAVTDNLVTLSASRILCGLSRDLAASTDAQCAGRPTSPTAARRATRPSTRWRRTGWRSSMGADYVEQDLAVTKDGVLICLHDPTLERTTNVEEVFPDRARPGHLGRQDGDVVARQRLHARRDQAARRRLVVRCEVQGRAHPDLRRGGGAREGQGRHVSRAEDAGSLHRPRCRFRGARRRGARQAWLRGRKADPKTPIILQTFSEASAQGSWRR